MNAVNKEITELEASTSATEIARKKQNISSQMSHDPEWVNRELLRIDKETDEAKQRLSYLRTHELHNAQMQANSVDLRRAA